ncbi:hypothetical protein SAMN05216480_11468 [Pustulibacterium marinum]|uniref:DUF1508 domain-containing protein n=1 Tax=Pustulibacterium marinum TaxID=1224947 RepID=A0A1I7IBU3_9FLAO|nr:YegP family protein [Pustulibacterium marinum]SFU70296.1 hypothetical protein SAMN05216480_11468 [Pustulibacterium marinum]
MFKIVFDKEKECFHFLLNSKNGGSLLLKSIAFDSKAEAEKAIDDCRQQVLLKSNIERKTLGNGKFHFIIKDNKRKILADSLFYSSEAGMQNGIEAIRKYIPIAGIDA